MDRNRTDSDEIVLILTGEIEKLSDILNHYKQLYKRIQLLCCTAELRGYIKEAKQVEKDIKALTHLRDNYPGMTIKK